jgi:hypothetical protein
MPRIARPPQRQIFSWHVPETFDEIQNLTDRVQSTRRVGTARQFNSNEEENHG